MHLLLDTAAFLETTLGADGRPTRGHGKHGGGIGSGILQIAGPRPFEEEVQQEGGAAVLGTCRARKKRGEWVRTYTR